MDFLLLTYVNSDTINANIMFDDQRDDNNTLEQWHACGVF